LLIQFWKYAKAFHDNVEIMKNDKEIDEFKKICEETTDCMEKLFGLDLTG
jgi:hypothetical protein